MGYIKEEDIIDTAHEVFMQLAYATSINEEDDDMRHFNGKDDRVVAEEMAERSFIYAEALVNHKYAFLTSRGREVQPEEDEPEKKPEISTKLKVVLLGVIGVAVFGGTFLSNFLFDTLTKLFL
jgi:hypothetical protein